MDMATAAIVTSGVSATFTGIGILVANRARGHAADSATEAKKANEISAEALGIKKAEREDTEASKEVRLTAIADWSQALCGKVNVGSFNVSIHVYNRGRQVRVTYACGWNKEHRQCSRTLRRRNGSVDILPDHTEELSFSAETLLGCEADGKRVPVDSALRLEIVGEPEPVFVEIENFAELREAALEWKKAETEARLKYHPTVIDKTLYDVGFLC
jgi:hypothetical protein